MRPRMIAPTGLTKPAAGVMATSPATAPDAAPNVVGCPSRSFSTRIQPSMAAALAVFVLTRAPPAKGGPGPRFGFDKADPWEVPAPRGGPGVEPEPAEPQQSGTQQSEGQ